MKEENKTAAVMAGVFLILYVLPFVMFLPMNLREGAVGLRDWPVLCHLLLPAAAGVLMILRKPKIAAVLMPLLAIMTIIGAVPQLREFLETGQYCATYDETTGHAEYIPMRFIVLPVLSIATSVFFAVMLYTRGRISLLLAVLIAAGEAAHTVFESAQNTRPENICEFPMRFPSVISSSILERSSLFTGENLITGLMTSLSNEARIISD